MTWFSRSGAARYVLAALALAAAAAAGFGIWLVTGPGPLDFAGGRPVSLAQYKGADPTGVPAELARAGLVARGEYLARAADCRSCHTAKGGEPFAGGLSFPIAVGTIYSPNITPDRQTGIGGWSDAAFLNALHNGIDDQGRRLYPAMPYASYSGMTDADALAIKAYLFSLKPVHNRVPENTLRFPFDRRWLMGLWSYFFNPGERFKPHADRSAEWNRGAYLAENLAHCGECHTPRNIAFALDNRRKFAGETQAGWRAYNISSDKGSGVGAWSDGELERYLASGHAPGRGTASGPMGEAVDYSFSRMAASDIRAIVAYMRSVPAMESGLPSALAGAAPATYRRPPGLNPRGEKLFAGACAGCHDWTGTSPIWSEATLTGARAVNDPSAVNVAQIVIEGARHERPEGTVFMPAFGAAYSDAEIADLANYVTARFGARGSSITARDVAGLRAQASH
ncbi:MAG TPA: cytochrome c [Rhizomicrobium sp.]|nr:cytochrome c [Rhizomicrobium sp.]